MSTNAPEALRHATLVVEQALNSLIQARSLMTISQYPASKATDAIVAVSDLLRAIEDFRKEA